MIEQVEQEMLKLVEEVGYDRSFELFKTLKGGKRLRAKTVLKFASNIATAPRLGGIYRTNSWGKSSA